MVALSLLSLSPTPGVVVADKSENTSWELLEASSIQVVKYGPALDLSVTGMGGESLKVLKESKTISYGDFA